jgi:hypothetical protein
MDARESTANNADLWARYLRDQWTAWYDPLRLRRDDAVFNATTRILAEATAAGVAAWLTMFVGQPVTRMYANNAPDVTASAASRAETPDEVVIPPQYAAAAAASAPAPDFTQREEWASVSHQHAEALAV